MATVDRPALVNQRLSRVLVLANLASSVGQAKRLISQGAVERNGIKITSDSVMDDLSPGDVIKAGRHRFVRVVE
jgi:ribosomal protein S4